MTHRRVIVDLIEKDNGEDVSETELKTIKVQLMDMQKKIDKLDDEGAIIAIDEVLERKSRRNDSLESLSPTATLDAKKVRARLPKLGMKKFNGKPH